jgi:hypothetical protein
MDMKKILSTIKFFGKKYAPEILLGTAAVAGTACIATSCRATIKAKKSWEEHQERKLLIADKLQSEQITSEESKVEMRKEIVKVGLELAKEYAIPFSLYTATIGCVLGSYKIQKSRLQAISATLSAMSAAYSSLVMRLKNGAENGLTAEEVLQGKFVCKVENEDGTVEEYTTTVKNPYNNPFRFRFDKYSTAWEHHHFSNECILRAEENWANTALDLNGYLFLNDVLDRLGLPKTKAGQILGWRKDGNGDGFVDFGVVDCQTLTGAEYDDNAFELNFNVDGDILTDFPNK